MIYKKCGTEFDGNVCPNCESYVGEDTSRKKKLTKKQLAVIICVVAAIVLVAVIVPSVVISNNIFRVMKVSKINVGDSQEQVIKLLGEPYVKDEYTYEYYSDNYVKIYERYQASGASESELGEQFKGRSFKYIRVEFDEEKKVLSLMFDANKFYDRSSSKTVSSYKLVTETITRFVPTDIVYSARFYDGSYYKGIATEDFVAYSSSSQTIKWVDDWKADYQKIVEVVENPDFSNPINCGPNAWGIIGADNIFRIVGNGALSEKLTDVIGDGITQVVISDGITKMDDKVFYNCSGLQNVEIPNSVAEIGDSAFYGCSSLQTVFLPNDLVSIGDNAFKYCDRLTIFSELGSKKITWSNSWNISNRPVVWNCAEYGVTQDGFKWGLTNDGQMIVAGYCGSATEVVIPAIINDCVVSIGEYAFNACDDVTRVVISNGITSIDRYAFSWCKYLESVTIPISVEDLGFYAFYGNNSRMKIYCEAASASMGWATNGWDVFGLPKWGYNNVKTDSDYDYVMHDGKAYLTKYKGTQTQVQVPKIIDGKEVASIGEIFSGNQFVIGVTIPSGVTRICNYAFNGCINLEYVNFENDSKLQAIGNSAFYRCNNLQNVSFGDNSKLTSIGNFAFYNCDSLVSVSLGSESRLTSIGYNAFYECRNLLSMDLSKCSQLQIIDDSAFYECRNLLSMDLSKCSQLQIIDDSSFYGCESLTSIYIPKSVIYIGEYAFSACESLQSMTVESGNSVYKSDGNCIIRISDNTLVMGCNASEIPDYVTRIGDYAFYRFSYLENAIIPNGVTSIGSEAFYNCSGLKSVEIPSSVTSIGEMAFDGCSGLESIFIPIGVTDIRWMVFNRCDVLTIYCESEVPLDGWSLAWNSNAEVIYGCADYGTAQG